jgi:hypothetical protein
VRDDPSRLRPADPHDLCGNAARIQQLGWKPLGGKEVWASSFAVGIFTRGRIWLMVDWSRLETAAGDATSTPRHLEGLISAEPQRHAAALHYLCKEVMHSNTVWPAVPVIAVHLAALLGDRRMIPPVRAQVLLWLYRAASDATEAETWGHLDEPDREMLAARPSIYQAVEPFLTDLDPGVRRDAIVAGAELLAAPDLEGERAAAQDRLLQLAARSPWRERAAIALALGRFGAVPPTLLHDEDWGVRVCLATSRGLDDDPSAFALVLEAFKDRRRLYEHFGQDAHPTYTTVQWSFDDALQRRRPGDQRPSIDLCADDWQ